jgi:hypothetical protein
MIFELPPPRESVAIDSGADQGAAMKRRLHDDRCGTSALCSYSPGQHAVSDGDLRAYFDGSS